MGLSRKHAYFTEFTCSKAVLYTIASLYVSAACVIVMLQPFLSIPCTYTRTDNEPEVLNALYVYNPCRFHRYPILLGLTVEECEFGRRLVWAVVLGCLIGWERKQADRPAGIRTMSLVALGSCLFSICSAFAFLSGPMAWDASRVSAAIPSGVGFLGSALIFKNKDDENNVHEVHGLTTAASVWLSAAVGIACAGGLYFVASLSTAIMLVLLRFGPRTNFPQDEEVEEEKEADELNNFLETGQQSTTTQLDIDEAIANLNKRYQATSIASPHGDAPSIGMGSVGSAGEQDKLIPRMSMSHSQSQRSLRRATRDGRPSLI